MKEMTTCGRACAKLSVMLCRTAKFWNARQDLLIITIWWILAIGPSGKVQHRRMGAVTHTAAICLRCVTTRHRKVRDMVAD